MQFQDQDQGSEESDLEDFPLLKEEEEQEVEQGGEGVGKYGEQTGAGTGTEAGTEAGTASVIGTIAAVGLQEEEGQDTQLSKRARPNASDGDDLRVNVHRLPTKQNAIQNHGEEKGARGSFATPPTSKRLLSSASPPPASLLRFECGLSS